MKIAADPNAGGWTWETNGNGGYILRMLMDVTGDGRDEIFLTSSLISAGDVAEWTVFRDGGDGNWSSFTKVLRLQANSIWQLGEGQSLSLAYLAAPDKESQRTLPQDEWKYPFYRFKFRFPVIEETLMQVSETDAAGLRPSDSGKLPKLEAILLADYVADHQSKWHEIAEWKMDANDCFFRSEDKDLAINNKNFTPSVALTGLDVRPEQKENQIQNEPPKGVSPATQATQISERVHQGHEKRAKYRNALIAASIAVFTIIIIVKRGRK